MNEKLITAGELAQVLKVPISWIYDRTRQGPEAIPFTKLGKYCRFNPDEVIRFFKDKGASMDKVV